MMRSTPWALVVATAIGAVATPSFAQQSTQMPSATQPGKGRVQWRSLAHYTAHGNDPTGQGRDVDHWEYRTQVVLGLTGNQSFMFEQAFHWRDVAFPAGGTDDQAGPGDLHLMYRWRFWQDDFDFVGTRRATLLMGLDLPTGTAEFGHEGVDPMLGLAFTQIDGRHGLNGAVRYMFNTGGSRDGVPLTAGDLQDMLHVDGAYLYRLAPDAWSAETTGAWYAMLETNLAYEVNGDAEHFISPGVMYEANEWVIEASVQLPTWQDVDERPETDYTITLGFRILF